MNTPKSFTLTTESTDYAQQRRELSTRPGAFIKAARMVLGYPLTMVQKQKLRELYKGGNPFSIGGVLGASATLDEATLRPVFGEAWYTIRQLLEAKDTVAMLMSAMEAYPRKGSVEWLTAARVEELGLVCMRGDFEQDVVYVRHPAKPLHYTSDELVPYRHQAGQVAPVHSPRRGTRRARGEDQGRDEPQERDLCPCRVLRKGGAYRGPAPTRARTRACSRA